MKLSGAELKSEAPAGWRTPRRFANFGGSNKQAPAFGVRQSSAAFSTAMRYRSPHLSFIPANSFAH